MSNSIVNNIIFFSYFITLESYIKPSNANTKNNNHIQNNNSNNNNNSHDSDDDNIFFNLEKVFICKQKNLQLLIHYYNITIRRRACYSRRLYQFSPF